MKKVYLLPFLFLTLIGCYNIKEIKICEDSNHHNISYPIPDSLKALFTEKEQKAFIKGNDTFWKDKGVLYIKYYRVDTNNKYPFMEGYFCDDAQVGKGKEYYSNGKVSLEWNFIMYNDSLKKVISFLEFNRMFRKKGWNGYMNYRQGQWKYYLEDGTLAKVDEYKMGNLINTK